MSEVVTMTQEKAIQYYEESMDEADKIAYQIAVKQLESSFDMTKSIGFLDFIQKQNIKIDHANKK
jgi:hypothetical protein